MNNPETSSYHLEIFSLYKEHNDALCELMNKFGLKAKTLERKKGYIIYLKEAEKIAEFLSIVGAHSALLRFEDVRIVRDMRNSVNRLVNCETANLNKTIGASLRQVENIHYIEDTVGLSILPDKLREIAELRIAFQDITLKELGEMVSGGNISKSGINHRLRKIDEIADRLRGERLLLRKIKLTGEIKMVEKQVEVKLKTGLQARPAALFVQEANRFHSDVFLEKEGKK